MITEHTEDPGRWEDCCRFFLLRVEDVDAKSCMTLPGCRVKFTASQTYDIYLMAEMEAFLHGGFNANKMGLGKVC